MIECDVCICYGMIISDEIAKQLQEKWNEDYYEQYVRCVNAWTCDEGWFFGITESALTDGPIMLLNDVNIPKFKINELERIIYKDGLEKELNWNPKYYIIEFSY